MKTLTCKECGGTYLINQDGAFVCQNCGSKYSAAEVEETISKNANKVNTVIAIVATSVIVVALATVGLIVLFGKSSDKSSVSSNQITSREDLNDKIGINNDLLSDIGKTYAELKKKYGEIVDISGFVGGEFYKFETGDGLYLFDYENGSPYPMDEYGNIICPTDNAICVSIITNVKDLFNGFSGSKSISEVEADLELSIEYYEETDLDNCEYDVNSCHFEYQNNIISIWINRNIGKTIEENAMAIITADDFQSWLKDKTENTTLNWNLPVDAQSISNNSSTQSGSNSASSTTSTTTTSTSTSTTTKQYRIPNFIGLEYTRINVSSYNMPIILEPEYVYSLYYKKGEVCEQSIDAGTIFSEKTTIRVKVSKGSQYVYLPTYEGKNVSEYILTLESLGIDYEIVYDDSYQDIDNGMVIYVRHSNGVRLDASTQIDKEEPITVYVVVSSYVKELPSTTT